MNGCSCCQGTTSLLSLVCDHILCMACADRIKVVEGQSTIENKYKLQCPTCRRATLTYDLNNLLMDKDSPSQANLMFQHLQSSQINESSLAEDRQVRRAGCIIFHVIEDATIKEFSHRDLKQMSYSQRFNNLASQRKQSKTPEIPFDRKQNRSKLSHDSGRQNNSKGRSRQDEYNTKCRDHNQNLMFYCETQKRLLCIECMYKHTRQFKSHKVVSIKNSMDSIVKQNHIYKEETKHRMDYLDECLKVCQNNKTILDQTFETSLELLSEQFNNLYTIIKNREAALKDSLRTLYNDKEKEVSTHIADVTYIKNCLKQYYNFTFEGSGSEIYFFNSYTLMREAMSKMNFNFKPLDKDGLSILDRGLTQEEVRLAVEKFIHIKKEKRSESRASEAQHNEKSKAALADEIKNAKKKLQRLEKMEKQEKSNHYLNNYIINLKQHNNQDISEVVRDRKNSAVEFDSKKQAYKPVTPTRVSSKFKAKK